MTDTPVVIVGGGPVGSTMALELALHGVASLLVEPHLRVDHSRPRAKTTSARSMELFRRTGAAEEIRRRAAIPVEWSSAIRFCTTATGEDITWFDGVLGLDLVASPLSSEPGQQVTQPVVEEALRSMIDAEPLIATRFGSSALAVELDGPRPRVTITDAEGAVDVVTADFVVGADGSRSVVRDALGARYEGAAGGRPNVNITFRSAELAAALPERHAIHHWVLNPDAPGVVGPLDLDGDWWAISTGTAAIIDDHHAVEIVRTLVGQDVDVEIIATDPWQARLLLSDSYGSGRAHLIGDAAHQNPPWGGHGFNTGVGDAVNLAWKLAAVISGWAPHELLDSYEADRRPIAQQTIDLAVTNMRSLAIDLSSPALMLPGAAGDLARAEAAVGIQVAKRGEFYSNGLVLGYSYGPDDGGQAPTSDVYLPQARPGNRLPHARSAVGDSLFDLLGPEFTLLGADTDRWTDAAASRGIPLVTVDPRAHGFTPDWDDALVLVRPDQHIAWLGPAGADPLPVLDAAVRGVFTLSD